MNHAWTLKENVTLPLKQIKEKGLRDGINQSLSPSIWCVLVGKPEAGMESGPRDSQRLLRLHYHAWLVNLLWFLILWPMFRIQSLTVLFGTPKKKLFVSGDIVGGGGGGVRMFRR